MIDTLRFSRRMVTAGVAREHAEAIAEGLADEVREAYPTKLDLERGFDGLRTEMQTFRAEIRAELQTGRSEVGAEFQALRAEIAADMQTLRAEVVADVQALRSEMRTIEAGMQKDNQSFRADVQREIAEMHKSMRDLAWRMAGLLLAQGAAVVALIRFVP